MFELLNDPIERKVKTTVCKQCKGRGVELRIMQSTEPCISCRGIGQVGGSPCFVCSGAGSQHVTKGKQSICHQCEGTGRVEQEPALAYSG